jgi:hypothetical protein
MFFFFKRPTIVVDCFTDNYNLIDHCPIDHASKFYPKWWDNAKPYFTKNQNGIEIQRPTLKKCTGLIHYYGQGFIMPLWSDLEIQIDEHGYRYVFADLISELEWHGPEQWEAYANPSMYIQTKIKSPWRLKCSKDINFLMTEPYWNYPPTKPYSIMSGVVDFKYQHAVNVNIMMEYKKQQISFKLNDPIYHIIPLTDKKIQLKYHAITREEFDKITFIPSYSNNYNQTRKLKDKQCPFHKRK